MSRRVIYYNAGKSYEPETVALMDVLGILNNSTNYGTSPYDLTGVELWTYIDKFFVATKGAFSLTLKVNNLSTVFDAMWLFLLDSATSCKYNAVNPVDSDAAFRLSFSGGWTFNGAGIKGNASNAYANTHWDSLAKAGAQQLLFGGYQRGKGTTGLEGTWDLTNATRIYEFGLFDGYTLGSQSSAGNANLRFTAVNLDSTNMKTYDKDGLDLSYSAPTLTLINKPFYLGARNNNNASINQYSDIEWAMRFITGKAVTESQILAWIPIVHQLQIDLKRNV
ncbi:MAG TPA: hypothetical protein VGF79_00800 [Bacteroidia bacterium]